MEKLLGLLNEYALTYADRYDDTHEIIVNNFFAHADQCFLYSWYENGRRYTDTLVDDVVISKRHGFIKYLVENNKIDYEKCIKEYKLKDFGKYYYISNSDNVIANLSIQENPIRFLIDLLK